MHLFHFRPTWWAAAPIACILSIGGYAQTNAAVDIAEHSFGGGSTIGQAVITRPEGYWISASMRTGGVNDIVLAELDGTLQLVGSTSLTSPGDDTPADMIPTADGGAIMVGTTTGFSTTGLEGPNAFLVKLNAARTVEWARQYGGPGTDRPNRVLLTVNGGYLVVGSTWEQGAGGSDAWMFRTDASGALLWSRTYGGGADDLGNDAHVSDDGTITLVGTTWNVPTGNAALVVHTDGNGLPLWSGTLDMVQPVDWNTHDRRGTVIIAQPGGGYCIGGTKGGLVIGGGQASMAFLLQLDTAGSSVGWCQSFHLNSGHTWFTRLVRRPDRLEAALEMGSGYGVVMRATPLGVRTWSRYLSLDPPFGPCRTLGYAPTAEGGFVVSGYHILNGDTTLLVAHGSTSGDLCFQGSTGPQFFLTGSDMCEMEFAGSALLSSESGGSTDISFSGSNQSPEITSSCSTLSGLYAPGKEVLVLRPTLCSELAELRLSGTMAGIVELWDGQGRSLMTGTIRADRGIGWNGSVRPTDGLYLLRLRDHDDGVTDFRFMLTR